MRSPLDGIIYESVQSQDLGLKDVLCAALRPEVTNPDFSLVVAGDHTLTYDPRLNKRTLSPGTEDTFANLLASD